MAIDFPWLRKMELEITGLANGGSRKYESDGTANKLRISARIHKCIAGLAEPAQIMIWNLSPDTRAGFQRSETKLRLWAGWEEGPFKGMKQCFVGDLQNSESYRSGPDIVTNIYALSGLDALAKVTMQQTWRSVSVFEVCIAMARKLASESDGAITTSAKDIVGLSGFVGDEGWSAYGNVRSSLSRLAKQYGFSWNVIDGRFYACGDREQFGNEVPLKSPYLVDVNPVFSSPLQWDLGIQWRSIFKAEVMPFYGVDIQSSISDTAAKYNGVYRVNKVVHDLDCYRPNSFITQGSAFQISKKVS